MPKPYAYESSQQAMASFEENTQVFIIRVWLEPREIDEAPAEWRGVIVHVESGKQRYLRDLKNLSAFIADYLEDMGVVLKAFDEDAK